MRILHSLLLSLLATAAAAQDAAPSRAVDALRPSGPVTVTADQAEWQDGGLMRYSGNVALVSDTLQLAGELLELRQFPDGQYEASIRGTPAMTKRASRCHPSARKPGSSSTTRVPASCRLTAMPAWHAAAMKSTATQYATTSPNAASRRRAAAAAR